MRETKPLKERVSLTIDNDVLTKLRGLTVKYDRSLSQLINIILKDYLSGKMDSREVSDLLDGK